MSSLHPAPCHASQIAHECPMHVGPKCRAAEQVWHPHMQPLADAMAALQAQKLGVGMQLQVTHSLTATCLTTLMNFVRPSVQLCDALVHAT